jgi:predicted secreted protein
VAFQHGKGGNFFLEDATTTRQDISCYLMSVTLPRSADTVEVTNFCSSAKEYLAGLRDATVSFEGIWDPTVDGILEGILGVEKDFWYYPGTTDATNTQFIQYTGSAILTAYEVPTAVDAAVTFSGEMQVTGVITRTTTT